MKAVSELNHQVFYPTGDEFLIVNKQDGLSYKSYKVKLSDIKAFISVAPHPQPAPPSTRLYWSNDSYTTVSAGADGALTNDIINNNLNGHSREEIVKAEIGTDVTSIGDYAFYEFFGLTNVTIPYSVMSIGEDAFAFCR